MELQQSPSPGWARALPPGPDARVKITEAYAGLVARDAYFWAWPMVNIYNRRLVMADVKEACPNQDVVYGLASIALDQSPVVVQVPEFGDRF